MSDQQMSVIVKIQSQFGGPVRRGGMHVPRLNFKSCHVAISEGPYFAVGISSTATPEIRRTSYVLLAALKF